MDNYSILNLKSGATIVEIKSRYRVLCKQYHPDKTGGDKAKTAQFLIIKDAYEALLKGDAGKRQSTSSYSNQNSDSNFKSKTKTGEYKFVNVKKRKGYYLINFYLWDVSKVEVRGYKTDSFGSYNTIDVYGRIDLRFSFEDAKKAGYTIICTLSDEQDNSAKEIINLEPPTFLDKFKKWLWKQN